MAKYVKYIFICLFAVFVMSHNTSAMVSPVFDLSNYELMTTGTTIKQDCIYSNTSLNVSDVYYCNLYEGQNLKIVQTHNGININEDDIVQFDLVITSNGDFQLTNMLKSNWIVAPNNYTLLDVSILDNNYYRWYGDSTTGTLVPDGHSINQVWRYTYKRFGASTNNAIVSIGSNSDNNFNFTANNISGVYLTFRLRNILVWRYVGSEENREQAQATQDAADDSSTAGSSSEQSAETATSSLISVIGGFVNVITSAQATNCKINMNTAQLDVGEIDLCANPVPSYVQIIGSLILICAVIPLAIILFNRFISLFRSFQG